MIKYQTLWKTEIHAIEVESETKHMVYLKNNRRMAKFGDNSGVYDTWQEAHARLLKDANDALDAARSRLQVAQDRLGNIKGMKPPKDVP